MMSSQNKLECCAALSPDFGSGRSGSVTQEVLATGSLSQRACKEPVPASSSSSSSSSCTATSCSATCEKLAVFICAGQREEDLLRAVKGQGSRSDNHSCTSCTAVCCRLQVSLPTKLLRMPQESADEQFARVPTAGVIAACKDYMTLQKKGQLSTWADKILGMGPAGSAKRAAALATGRKSAMEMAATSEETDGTRRLELLNAIAAMLDKVASAPAWESDADRRFALTVAKISDAKSGAHRSARPPAAFYC